MPERSHRGAVSRALRSLVAASVAHPYAADVGIAVVVLVAVSVPFVLPWHADTPPTTWQGYLLATGTAVPLIWRRRVPLASALAVAVFTVALVLYDRPGQPMQYGAVVSVFTMASVAVPWQRIATVALWCAGIVIVGAIDEDSTAVGDAFAVLTILSAYALGALTRTRRAHTTALEERTRRLEWERQIEAERAAAAERARIAREMHDVLAHAVSLMVVQAEAGPVAVRSDPDRAAAAFDAIAAAGRDAMAQLRGLLSVLREDDHVGAERAPQPTMARLPELAEEVTRAGLRVQVEVVGAPRPLRPDIDVAAYRVVQEALTNTVRHAAAASAIVRLDWRDEGLTIVVSDDGHGTTGHDGGHGLLGIRERVAAFGGSASAGPASHGRGFVVSARLPVGADGVTP
ncbi:MAG TPA: histidine kinase [Euzebyales bacterium]|nr:histidine kinase [Euzebyales bacterium]